MVNLLGSGKTICSNSNPSSLDVLPDSGEILVKSENRIQMDKLCLSYKLSGLSPVK